MRSTIVRASLFGLAVALMVSSMGAHTLATASVVPEIDGSTLSAGLAAAAAGVLILRARRRSK